MEEKMPMMIFTRIPIELSTFITISSYSEEAQKLLATIIINNANCYLEEGSMSSLVDLIECEKSRELGIYRETFFNLIERVLYETSGADSIIRSKKLELDKVVLAGSYLYMTFYDKE